MCFQTFEMFSKPLKINPLSLKLKNQSNQQKLIHARAILRQVIKTVIFRAVLLMLLMLLLLSNNFLRVCLYKSSRRHDSLVQSRQISLSQKS